jgi:peptide deformylase
MIDTDINELCQIMQVTLFNETVGQGEGCISWVDISFEVSRQDGLSDRNR